VRIEDPADYFAFDHMSADEMLAGYEREQEQMTNARSVLPKEPDRALVAGVLRGLRLSYLT
jgi:hypothetical protein